MYAEEWNDSLLISEWFIIKLNTWEVLQDKRLNCNLYLIVFESCNWAFVIAIASIVRHLLYPTGGKNLFTSKNAYFDMCSYNTIQKMQKLTSIIQKNHNDTEVWESMMSYWFTFSCISCTKRKTEELEVILDGVVIINVLKALYLRSVSFMALSSFPLSHIMVYSFSSDFEYLRPVFVWYVLPNLAQQSVDSSNSGISPKYALNWFLFQVLFSDRLGI